MMKKLSILIVSCLLCTASLHADMSASVSKVKPSVVIVGTYKSTSNPRFRLRGTGFVVATDRQVITSNLVITNAHVLPKPADEDVDASLVIQVRGDRNELQTRTVTVLELDKVHDLALLRFEGPAAPALALRDSADVKEGQAVAFTGFPIGGVLGFSPVTHRGMISSIVAAALPTPTAQQLTEKTIRSVRNGSFEIFQLDGTAYPGNSGGPLFDPESAEVLGVVNMVLIKGTREAALSNPSGISYAIPSRFVMDLLKSVKGN
jgi:S1-C subfamily serine protease